MKFDLEIVTPNKVLTQDQADEIIIPAAWGQMDVFPQHVDFITTLTAGELAYRKAGSRTVFQIAGGLIAISGNKVTVLVDGLVESAAAAVH